MTHAQLSHSLQLYGRECFIHDRWGIAENTTIRFFFAHAFAVTSELPVTDQVLIDADAAFV
jgi:hypothetical protein